MKRKYILLIIFSITFFLVGTAQDNHKIDSLLNALKTAKEDTSKVNILNILGTELTDINTDTSIILAKQALLLSEKVKSKKHMADSYQVIVLADYRIGNYYAALENSFKILSIRKELADKHGIANALQMLGSIYSDQSDYIKALEYQFMSLKIREELGIKKGIAKSLSCVGYVYSSQGDHLKALDYYSKALKIYEKIENKSGIAFCTASIGDIFNEQNDYTKALEYYLKSLKINEELGNNYRVAWDLGNIGTLYAVQSDYPNALSYYFKALEMFEKIGNKIAVASFVGKIGCVYIKTGKFITAEEYLKKAIALHDSIGSLNGLRQFEESLSQLYDTTGRYKLALEHHKKAMVLKDTIFSQEKNEEITRKELNYEFEKTQAADKAAHEKQLAVADVAIKKQKLLKNSFLGVLVLTLLLFFFVYRFYRAQQVLRLQNIRNRIASDLHDDVGSTLNSISVYSEVAKQKSPIVVNELEQIGDASRNIIEVMSDIVWTINPKYDTFENIIIRMSALTYNLLKAKNIEHTFRADESLNETKLTLESRRNFYLIFKEALNNLVKYSNATRASISLAHENGLINLSVRDNGVGFDIAQTSKGNGLINMKVRAEEINAQLKIESEKGSGTNIELILKA